MFESVVPIPYTDAGFFSILKFRNMDIFNDKYLNPQLKAVKNLITSARVQNGLLYVNVPSAIQVAQWRENEPPESLDQTPVHDSRSEDSAEVMMDVSSGNILDLFQKKNE